jgi:hypothetical protein
MLPAITIAIAAAIPIFRNTARISLSCLLVSFETIGGSGHYRPSFFVLYGA